MMMQKFGKFLSQLSFSWHPNIPLINLRGPVSRQMTNYLLSRLESVSSRNQYLFITVNCKGGSLSQANIISQRLQQIQQENKLKVYTFAQQYVLNAGMLILLSGNKVFVENSTVVGGLQCGSKFLRSGKLTELIPNIYYSKQQSYTMGSHIDATLSEEKTKQVISINQQFSANLNKSLRELRKNKISEDTNLSDFYVGPEAIAKGIVDQLGRVYSVAQKVNYKSKVKLLHLNKFEQISKNISKMNKLKQLQ